MLLFLAPALFAGPFSRPVVTIMTLKNNTSVTMVFKIKTTAPKRYCVRPNIGKIAPYRSTQVESEWRPPHRRHNWWLISLLLLPSSSLSPALYVRPAGEKQAQVHGAERRGSAGCRFNWFKQVGKLYHPSRPLFLYSPLSSLFLVEGARAGSADGRKAQVRIRNAHCRGECREHQRRRWWRKQRQCRRRQQRGHYCAPEHEHWRLSQERCAQVVCRGTGAFSFSLSVFMGLIPHPSSLAAVVELVWCCGACRFACDRGEGASRSQQRTAKGKSTLEGEFASWEIPP